ncbi:type II secretion system minor pseudopilin GspJ [Thiohalobacter sp. IOR34]|uniref:type II secretion system minor pseudopilin GspJ n=1 Tax=Thiohalobacter sp. IOR34 TaxID=3057176 RepID=UPI0025B2330C|nr:type II secretion system minor pseudopilin GspJ [Thiohalobacter sp. IOR34]WJW75225.1 type II secretion system minor pseudopilin GspJ [Thiohalobacter sp. IOR34]
MRMRGFTLLELLVAMAIFALLAMLAYGGLNNVLMTRAGVEAQAEALKRLQLGYRWLQRDLEQAVLRPVRDSLGDSRPALLAGGSFGTLLALTREGWSNPAGQPRSHLQRVVYRLEEDRLLRAYWPALDRAPGAEPLEAVLLEGVSRVELRFLDPAGEWRPQWPPANQQGEAGLPRAVELIVETDAWGALRWLFRLPD